MGVGISRGVLRGVGEQASCHLVLVPQLFRQAIEHVGNVGQPSPSIQRASICQPPAWHTLHPQEGQFPGLPEGCEIPLRHICLHVLVKFGADDHPDNTRGLACYSGQLSREVFKGGTVGEGEEE